MKSYSTLLIEKEPSVVTIRLNRPEVHNAFNQVMMEELTDVIKNIPKDKTRLIVLTGSRPNFCAGADLSWMQTGAPSELLRKMYSEIRSVSCPIVSRVFGNVFAGGVGLCAATDIVYAEEGSHFCISEARVGLIPAVMSPFLVEKIGVAKFRELIFTARRFTTCEALQMGLVDFVVPKEGSEYFFKQSIETILKSGPEALAASKLLCRKFASFDWGDLSYELAEMLTDRRMSAECQEGVKAFLEKRPPNWK